MSIAIGQMPTTIKSIVMIDNVLYGITKSDHLATWSAREWVQSDTRLDGKSRRALSSGDFFNQYNGRFFARNAGKTAAGPPLDLNEADRAQRNQSYQRNERVHPFSREYFDDPIHPTDAGISRVVTSLSEAMNTPASSMSEAVNRQIVYDGDSRSSYQRPTWPAFSRSTTRSNTQTPNAETVQRSALNSRPNARVSRSVEI